MATKAVTKTVAVKENKASKKETKAAAPAKVEKKAVKAALSRGAPSHAQPQPALAAVAGQPPAVDPDELEEQEESAAAASNQSSSAAALAAASTGQEMSASFKNFRHHPDMENFYRFIYENDLRHEALAIIDEVLVEKRNRRELKAAKAQAH